ncbi:MAG: BON domain-containing protein [Myxococcales bacterium]|nr:BON domain-containing protein [Myxococcales bacterium]
MHRPTPPPRDGLPYFTTIPRRAPEASVDQDVDLRQTRDIGQGAHVQRQDPNHVDGHADASYPGYGVYATLDGSRVDTSEFADPEWAGAELEPDRPTRPGNGPPDPSLRDDAELAAELRDLLTGEPDLADASIAVSVEGGEVLLAGHVRDTRCKHLAEDLAYRVAGVLDVTNLLIVASIDGALERDLDAPAALLDDIPNLLPHSLRGPGEDSALRRLGADDRHDERKALRRDS